MQLSPAGGLLRNLLNLIKPVLLSITEEESQQKTNPDKWSKKEVLGHLIDSAANNHHRFVNAQFQDDLCFRGYRQEEWVIAQQYNNSSWNVLIELWASYNLHLAHVMDVIPSEVRYRKTKKHNFHQIAWKTIPEGQEATLEYFIIDYLGHLEHHLGQIIPHYQKKITIENSI